MVIAFMDSSYDEPPCSPDAVQEAIVVVAMERRETDSSVRLLHDAGFAADSVDVLVVEEVPRLEERLGGSGLHRFLVRLRLVRGDDLDLHEPARRELMNGRALIQVAVNGYEEQRLAMSVLGLRSSRERQIARPLEDLETRSPVGTARMGGAFEPGARPLLGGWHPAVNEIRHDRVAAATW